MKKKGTSSAEGAKKTHTKAEARREKLTRGERRREWGAAFLVVLSFAAFLGIAALIQRVFIPLSYYNKAGKLMEQGSYIEAQAQYKLAGDFSDSKEKIEQCKQLQTEKDYQSAVKLYEEGKFDEALTAFTKLSDYSSSQEYCKKALYGRAGQYLEIGEYDKSRADYETLGDFGDSQEMILECDYRKAGWLCEHNRFMEGVELYNTIADYKDSLDLSRKAQADFNIHKLKTADPGAVVLFGHYEQDGNTKNGAEDLEWIVLDRTENAVMLISRYLLAEQVMGRWADSSLEWAGSSLRTWCNTTFYDAAFVESEKAVILTTEVPVSKNPSSGLEDSSTQDKVFILSLEEANQYFDSEEALMAQPTEKAVNDGLFRFTEGTSFWWLRTRGASNWQYIYFTVVNNIGFIDYTRGISYDSTDVGVRPVIWISIAE